MHAAFPLRLERPQLEAKLAGAQCSVHVQGASNAGILESVAKALAHVRQKRMHAAIVHYHARNACMKANDKEPIRYATRPTADRFIA